MESKVINFLLIGDVIGEPGINILKEKIKSIQDKYNINYTIVNGENSDKGFGINQKNFDDLVSLNVNVVTSGNHIWSNKKIDILLEKNKNLLRPLNYFEAIGNGYLVDKIDGEEIAIVNIIGRYNMTPVDCPFQALKKLIQSELQKIKIIVVDFHAELMQEKKTLAYMFDGKVSFVAGTHTHVQTADDLIFPNGTGYISDIGMTGGIDSVIGMQKEFIVEKNLKQINVPYIPSEENLRVQGVVVSVDSRTGNCINIVKVNESM